MSTTQSILFDVPGRRARRRIRIAAVLSLLAFALLIYLALERFNQAGQLAADRWRPFTATATWTFLWSGIVDALRATVVAAALSFPLGAILALMRLSTSHTAALIAKGYIALFRAIPLLLILYVFLLVLPSYGLTLSVFWMLVGSIVLVNTAILAEVFRAGVLALPLGQTEAAQAIGLTHWQSMRIVILPQAVRVILPALVTSLVSILKDTTLGFVVSYPELMQRAYTLTAITHLLVQTFLVITILYIVVNLLLSRGAERLDAYLRRSPRVGASPDLAEAADTGFH